jgi:hypothetical protein
VTWYMASKEKRPIKAELMQKQNGLCAYCGRAMTVDRKHERRARFATIEHIVPIAGGGSNEPDNLMLCCRICNIVKGHSTLEEFIFGLLWIWLCKNHPLFAATIYRNHQSSPPSDRSSGRGASC